MIHNKRLNVRTYFVVLFFTIVIFFCAAVMFSEDRHHAAALSEPEPEWGIVTIHINEKTYDCEFNTKSNIYYYMGYDEVITVSDESCVAAVTEWSHTWPKQMYKI